MDTYRSKRVQRIRESNIEPAGNYQRKAENQRGDTYRSDRVTSLLATMEPAATVSVPEATVSTDNKKKKEKTVLSPGGTFLGGMSYYGTKRREKTEAEKQAEARQQAEYLKEYQRLLSIDTEALSKEVEAAKNDKSRPKYQVNALGGYDSTKKTEEQKIYSSKLADLNKAKTIQYEAKGAEALEKLSASDGAAVETLATERQDSAARQAAWQTLQQSGYTDDEISQLINYQRNIPKRQKNAELYSEIQDAAAAYAETNPGLATLASVPANLVSGIGTADAALRRLSDPNSPTDYKSAAMLPYAFSTTARGTVSENLEREHGKAASFLYGVGTSIADSAATAGLALVGVPAGLASATLGGAAATDAMVQAKERGLSDNEAIVNGVAAGVFETLFEKVSLDSLITMKAPTGSFKQKVAGTLKNSLKQAGIEGSEELATSAANLFFDHVAHGQMSDAQQRIYAYMAQGMDYDDAKNEVEYEILMSMAQDFAAGALAGGLMGGGGSAVQAMSTPTEARQKSREKAHIKGEYKTSETGKTTYKGKEVSIDGVDAEGNMVLSSGESVKANEVEYADRKTAEVYEGLNGSETIPAAARGAIARSYEGKQESDEFVHGMEEAYRAGAYGIPMEDMTRSGFNTELTETQKKLAYDLGAAMRKEQTTQKAALSDGGIVYEDGIDRKKLTKMQKDSIKVAEVISKAIGGKVHLYSSTQNAKGIRTADQQSIRALIGEDKAPNGFYDHKTGDIYLDINSGNDGEGTMLYTLAHEYTHMMRQNAKESFDKLTELLFQKYRENGEDVEALILAKQERMDTDYDTAFEEFVADSMEAMLTDTNAAERIAWLKETDKTAWEKLKELVHKLLESIKGLYEQYSPSSVEGKRVREMGDALEKLSDLFVEGMSKVGEQGTSEGKISYSIREIRDNSGKSYGIGVYLDSTLLENLTDAERVQMVRERVKELGGQTFVAYDASGNEVEIKIAENGRKFPNKSGKTVSANKDLATKNSNRKIKQEAVVLADELIEAASFEKANPSKYSHGWLDNYGRNDWQYWKTYIQDKNNTVWEATLNIAESENGEKILYDIDPIKKAGQSVKSDTSTANNNVPQQTPVVNKRFSKQDRDSSDSAYMAAARRGDTKTAQKMVDEAAKASGYTYHLYHGTGAEFNVFDVKANGGKHGTGEGYGIYLASNKQTAGAYGERLIDSYVKFNRIAEGSKRTLSLADVKRIIKASCEASAKKDVADGEYDSLSDALRDTWVSNYVDTYSHPNMETVYSDVAKTLYDGNDNDGDIINEIMFVAGAHYSYKGAMEFYDDVLTPTTGIDGFHYVWGENNDVYLAFNSEQIKSAEAITRDERGRIIPLSERFNSGTPDIRYQERGTSNREILTTALESAAQNPREREVLAEYKAAADKLDTYETRLRENRAKLQELTVEGEKKNARRIAKLKEDIKADENRVGNVTDQMETLENRESLRALLAREREAIVAQQQEQVRQLKERLDEYREKYGTFPGGEKAAREILLPRKSKDGAKISQTVRTILEASSTPEEAVPTIEEMALDGRFSYETYSDKESIADAESEIKRVGWAQSLSSWMSSIEKGNVSKQNTAMGWALYNNAANSGDTNTALDILSHMVEHQRSAAQALQATRILKEMSPTTQLYQVQRSVENLQAELNKRFGDKKAPELKVDPELAEQFMAAPDQEGRDAAMRSIYRDIGKQMPSKFIDKWNAWRYLAMLGNARTHVRNVVGNAGFVPVVATKDVIATGIESAVHRLSGGRTERTKSFVSGKGGKALLAAAVKDYAKIQEVAMGGGKYSEFANANKYIEEGRVIFKSNVPGLKQASKALEKARRANSKALDAEDVWFSKPHYAYAMAQYCRANGITAEMIESGKGDAIAKARDYAINEAQKATYRDTNSFSQAISELGRVSYGRKSGTKKAISTIMEGILPFRKTPANILVRGIEYSPLGLMNGIKKAVFDVRKGNATSAEAIDAISAGLTGTGLLMFGIYLAAEGVVRGHGDDEEKENTFAELTGHQAYALELPDGTSVTLDWLAPECLPFFIGVNLWELTEGGTDILTMADALNAVSQVSEPLLEMSCLQSLDAIFDTVGYAKSNDTPALVGALASAGTSYLTQALPTLLGQAERTSEDIRYTTYTDPNSPLTSDMQYTLGKASARIPGVDFSQIPYIDAWGRRENTGSTLGRFINNFLNPAYTSNVNESAMEQELLRVYESTGDTSVFPSRAKKTIRSNGEDVKLTGEQYVEFAEKQGGNAYKWLNELVNRSEFKKLSDVEKASCVGLIYQAARETASGDIVSGYEKSSWVADALSSGSIVDAAILKTKYPDANKSAFDAYKEYGSSIGRDTFLEAYSALGEMTGEDYDGDGRSDPYSKIDKKLAYIDKMALTDEQKRAMAIAADISEKSIDGRAPWN